VVLLYIRSVTSSNARRCVETVVGDCLNTAELPQFQGTVDSTNYMCTDGRYGMSQTAQ